MLYARVKGYSKNLFGAWSRAGAPGSGRGARSSPAVQWCGGLAAVRAGGGRAWCCGCADQDGRGRGRGLGCRVWRVGARARVVLGGVCAVCGILRVWAVGVWWFLGAVCGAWCSLRGDGVASVVVVVWCRLVYPRNKTCNAKTSYKCAILLLACKSPCGA